MTSRRRKSKKQSGTSIPPAKQLEPYTFFVERSLGGKTVPEQLAEAGLKVERHKDHFAHNAEDVEWLSVCGEREWVVLTKDRAIRSNELELKALINAGVATFVITSAGMSGEDAARAYLKALPRIARYIEHQTRPFIARVSPEGEVTLWIDSTGKDLMRAKQKRDRVRNERSKGGRTE